MARGRLISRSLGSSRKFHAVLAEAGKLGEFAQLLFPLLVTHTDDYGRMAGDAFTVKHAVLPSSPRPERDFEAALVALAQVGLLRRYGIDGAIYLEIQDFDAHQVNLHKRTHSRIPEPPGISGNFRELPAQEKRTEENRREGKGTVTVSAAAGCDAVAVAPAPALLTFPVTGGDQLWSLTSAQVDRWQTAYDTLDVLAECRKALVWLEANPSRRKTDRGMPAFLANWLNRAANQPRGVPAVSPAPVGNRRIAGLMAGGAAFMRRVEGV